MAIETNKSLVQFGYAVNKDASTAAGFITFDSGKQAIYVGDGTKAKLVTPSVKNVEFDNALKVLTITKLNGDTQTLDFSDVASAEGVNSLLATLRTDINKNAADINDVSTRVNNLDTSYKAADASLQEAINLKADASTAALKSDVSALSNKFDTSYGILSDADASLNERIEALEKDDTASSKVAKVTSATENNIVVFGVGGEVKDVQLKAGNDTLSENADASTLATELAVKTALNTVASNADVEIEADSTNLIYTIKQGGSEVGKINIPKDMVVESGAVVENPEGQPTGTYIKLVLKNVENPLYINVTSLIEYVTSGSEATDMVVITVSDDHKVSATITDGSITKAKLDASVQASLGKADTAVQTITSGDTNGSIKVDGTDVAVSGLGTAAFTNTEAYATAAQGAKADTAIQGVTAETPELNNTDYVAVHATEDENSHEVTLSSSVKVQRVAEAAEDAKGLAEASDVKAYVDSQIQAAALTWTVL